MHATPDKSRWAFLPPEFSHINRVWDASHGGVVAKILPGEFYVTRNNEIISTVLGSCVAACIRDVTTGIGGMNHFMLPEDGSLVDAMASGTTVKSAYRYGGAAMKALVDTILGFGGNRDGLEVKLFGGGKVLDFEQMQIGERNIEFAREYVRKAGLQLVAEDLGLEYPRRVVFWPETGRVRMRRLRRMQVSTVVGADAQYRNGGRR